MLEKEITFDRFIRGVLAVLGVVLSLLLINRLSAVLLPFFIAWLLAYMLYPTVKFYQLKLRVRNRVLSIIITLLTLVAIVTGIVMMVIPSIIEEFMRLRDVIAHFLQNGANNNSIPSSFEAFIKENINENQIMQFLHQESVVSAIREAIPRLDRKSVV